MRKQIKRAVALMLCAVLVLSMAGITRAQAVDPAAPASAQQQSNGSDHYVYAKANETTFVPAGYTYVYTGADGQTYTRVANSDMYITGRVLTATEANALAKLEYGEEGYITSPDGSVLNCKEFDAKQAAAYSDAIREILGDAKVKDGEKVSVVSEAFTSSTEVKVMITFAEDAVIQMDKMQVNLGQPLGEREINAMRAIETQQRVMSQTISQKLGYDIQVSENFTLLTNAVSATVKYGDLAAINQMKGVKNAFLMPSYQIPEINATTVSGSILPNLKFAAPAMGADKAWDLGYKGEGMSVAIIDTGLCFENSSFSIQPKDQSLVAYDKSDIAKILADNALHAETLTEGITVDNVYHSSKIPFGYNYADKEANFGSDDETWFGHGSHVAGIVAGNLVEEAKEQFEMETMGLAPEAQLVIMKVFDQSGACYLDYLVAAIEDAIMLGVDCANLSLGAACGPVYYEGVTEVYDAAYKAGINVVVSAGNDAFTGYKSYWGDNMVKSSTVSTGTLGMPGTFDSVMTVASADNDSEVSFSDVISWYNKSLGIRQMMFYGECEDVPEGKGFKDRLSPENYVFTDSMKDAEGKLVFFPFEGGNADAVAKAAADAKAAGVILYDATPAQGEEGLYVKFSLTRFDVPMATTDKSQYDWMLKQRPEGNVVRVDSFWNPSETAGQMSSFSSWGPTDGLTLKPEITGIGGNVFSAYYGDNFAVASGTSMSSPAVAASAALVRQYLKTTGVKDADLAHMVNCLLMSTATPILDEEHGAYYPVRQQGAGLANVAAAIRSQAYIQVEGTNKAKLELGDDPNCTGVYKMTFQVVNSSDTQKTYTLDTTVLGQVAQGGQIREGQVTYLTYDYDKELGAQVSYNVADGTVTVPANGTATVTVTVSLTEADKAYMDERFPYGTYVEGFVQLLSDETPNLSVPFLAFYGDFGAAPILEEGTYDTLLAGDKAYTTADQFHNAIWGYLPGFSVGDVAFGGSQFYLGDSKDDNNQKVPERNMSDYPPMGYLPFYPSNAGISPNGDNILDTFEMGLGLRRNAKSIHYTVTNVDTGEVIWDQRTEFVSKSYFSDSNNRVMYGGIYDEEALSMEWLYPLNREEYDFDGDGVIDQVVEQYDTSKCLLEENTWVSIQAEVIPEYESATKNAHNTVEFTLYIDTKAPCTSKDSILFGDRSFFEPLMWGQESFPDGMLHLAFRPDEYWFMDLTRSITLFFDEETNSWGGMMFTGTSASPDPLRGNRTSLSESGFSVGGGKQKQIFLAYDYVGNVSAFEMEVGESLLDLVELTPETTVLKVGETMTIQDVAKNDFETWLSWEASDETLVEVKENDWHSCTVKGLAPGRVTIYGGFADLKKPVTITVIDPANLKSFTDIKGHWAENDINSAVGIGLFKGTSDTTFSPEKTLTRGELVTILYRMAGEPKAPASSSFTDVPAGKFYSEAVAWAAENGIVKGLTKDTFAPNLEVTREQIATILYRYAEFREIDVSEKADLSGFQDAGKVSNFAKDAMAWAVAVGLIRGIEADTLAPNGVATRAQAATLAIRFLDL